MMKCCDWLELTIQSGLLRRELVTRPSSIDPSQTTSYEEIRFPPRATPADEWRNKLGERSTVVDAPLAIEYCPFCGEKL